MVSGGRHHDGGHDGGDVECRPFEHELVQEGLLGEVLVASFAHSLLHGDSSGIVERVRLVSVVVGLNQKPVLFAEFVVSVSSVGVAFNDHTLISTDTRNDEVNGSSGLNGSQSFGGSCIGGFFFESFFEGPESRHGVVDQNTDKIFAEIFGFSGIAVDSKSSMSDAS